MQIEYKASNPLINKDRNINHIGQIRLTTK